MILWIGILLIALVYLSSTDNEDIEIGANVENRAPDFTLYDMEGNEVALSHYRGRPVVINFWTTSCYYCRLELPHIQGLYDGINADYGNDEGGVKILTINITVSERSLAAVEEFVQTNEYTFPILLDEVGDVARLYNIRGIPANFFIDRDGIIRHVQPGFMSKEDLQEKIMLIQ